MTVGILPATVEKCVKYARMPGSRGAALAAAGLWILALAFPATGQPPTDQPPPTPAPPPPAPLPPPVTPTPEEPPPIEAPPAPRPTTTPEEPLPGGPGVAAPPTFVGPDFFNPPPPRGWLTLTPSIAIVEEYNDNLFRDTRNETEDFITGIVPGFTVSMQRPEYTFLAGYNFTAELYANESENNGVAKRQQLIANAFYRFGPTLTFTLLERFIYDRETTAITLGGISTGRQEALRNTITPRLEWQATPRTSLNFSGSYTLLRFQEDGRGVDSDTYRLGVGGEYTFTRRFSGTADVNVAYLDPEDEDPGVTYTPRVGFIYQFTPTLRGLLRGGPSIFIREGDARVTPAASAELEQSFRAGSLSVGYDRAVVAETVGVTDRQTVYAQLRLPTLTRGLVMELIPRYTHADRDVDNRAGGDDRKIDALTVNLRASYEIARNITLIGAYTFFHQRVDPGMGSIDQNRVFFGVQYAYPINFD